MSIPCDISRRSWPEGRRTRTKRCKPLNIRNNPNLSSLHNFIQNRQPKGSRPDKLQTCFFHHMICAFASSISKTFGGGGRDRTDDPLLAKQVLSQLSYAPVKVWEYGGPGRT